MKRTIRLNEFELKRIISESVKKTINEVGDTPKGQYMLGRAAARNRARGYASWHNGDGDNGIEYSKRAKKLGQHAMSKLKYDKDASVFSELLGDLYNFISSFCSTKMSEDDYEHLMGNVEEHLKEIYRLIKQKTDELTSKPYLQGYSDNKGRAV